MLIDWFTVGAQVLNFVFLVWLMKRFLYQPVLDAIAAREKRIADQIANAAAQKQQASAERQIFEDKNTAFDAQRAGLMEKASADAKAEGQQLADQAQKEALALAAQRQQALARQGQHLQQLIASRAAKEVFVVARKTLADLANANLETRMVEVFMQRLKDMPAAAKDPLGAALKQGTDPGLLRSHFELPAEQQAAIRDAVKLAFSADVPLRFETAASTVCGIELSAGGQKLAWTIDEYLRDLEHEVAAVLAPSTQPVAAPKRPEAPQPDAAAAPQHNTITA